MYGYHMWRLYCRIYLTCNFLNYISTSKPSLTMYSSSKKKKIQNQNLDERNPILEVLIFIIFLKALDI